MTVRNPVAHAETSDVSRAGGGPRLPGAVWFVLAGAMVAIAAVTGQGADLLWGVAMGDRIRASHGIPQSVPFAAAPSDDWSNPMALGETLLSLVHSVGPTALVVLHLLLVATALGLLVARGVNAHCREARTSVALTLVVVGGIGTLAIARMPSLSLVPYAALVVLLLRQADHPSTQLWLAVPLIALWGNLHGGVLVGCALLSVALLFHGGPIRQRILIGVAAVASVFLLTSAGWRSISYYRDVLGNEAARQHVGLWAQPSLHRPLDVVMLLAIAATLVMWMRSEPRRWEVAAVLGMVMATTLASRNSIWLLLFLLPLASRGRHRPDLLAHQTFPWKPAVAALGLALLGVGWQVVSRGTALNAQGVDAVPTVRSLAAGRTVLAIDPVDETFAQAGIRVWAGNPFDAFPRPVQQRFLAFMDNGAIPRDESIGLVVVNEQLASKVRAEGWLRVASIDGLVVFERRPNVLPTGGAAP